MLQSCIETAEKRDMKITNTTRVKAAILSLFALVSIIPAQDVFAAAPNSISITPSSQSVEKGSTFSISVNGYVGTNNYPADTVSGTLTFPANLLSVTSVSTAGSAYTWQNTATPNNTNGTVTFTEKNQFYSQPNGAIHIMTITFHALANGSAHVGFTPDTTYSETNPFGVILATDLSGGTYTISTTAPPTCPSGQIGTPPNCTTPTCPTGQSGTPPNCKTLPPPTCPAGQTGTPPNCKTPTTPPKTTTPTTSKPPTPATTSTPTPTPVTPFAISDTSTTRGYNTAAVDWKTNIAATGTVTYGASQKQQDKNGIVTLQQDGSYEAALKDLTPGKKYYFTITAISATDATKTDSYSGTFTTKGFPVIVTVSENNKAVSSAKLKIGEQNYSTDRTGKANLELASGTYTLVITTANGSKTVKLTVVNKTIPENNGTPEKQNFSFDVPATAAPATANQGMSLTALIGIGVGGFLVLLILLGLFLLYRRRKQQDNGSSNSALTIDNYSSLEQPQQSLPPFPQEQPDAMMTAPENVLYADPMATTPNVADLSQMNDTLDQTILEAPQQDLLGQPDMMGIPDNQMAAAETLPAAEYIAQVAAPTEMSPDYSSLDNPLSPSTSEDEALAAEQPSDDEQTEYIEEDEGERMAPPSTVAAAGELQIEHGSESPNDSAAK